MRFAILLSTCLIVWFTFSPISVSSQDSAVSLGDLEDNTMRIIAIVKGGDFDMIHLEVESIVSYGRGITTTPEQGEEIAVRLPGRNKPETESRIEVDLIEKIDVGARPSSYLLKDFRTIQ